jgi:hypothetical protein
MANLSGQDHWFMNPPSRPPIPFGGVINDSRVLVRTAQFGVGDGGLIFSTIALIDLPLSLGMDIITLPWATSESIREKHHPSNRYHQFEERTPEPSVETNAKNRDIQ